MRFLFKNKKQYKDLDPDQIFLDSENLPSFDSSQCEGQIQIPLSTKSVLALSIIFFLFIGFYLIRVFNLQVVHGSKNADITENNRLRHNIIFADRGVIFDRNGVPLAWNEVPLLDYEFSQRKYIKDGGFSHILGYLKYPQKDNHGFYYRTSFEPKTGVEFFYDDILSGENGLQIVEVDAVNNLVSSSTTRTAEHGQSLYLSIDSRIQNKVYETIKKLSEDVGFRGGVGLIMDISSGELISAVSYPEFDSNLMTAGITNEELKILQEDENKPFLNRMTDGLYTPGSIIKPYMAVAGLTEGVIDQNTIIVSTGSLIIPNPYNPDEPSVFNDWKTHGPVTIRDALAYSSNEFFYQVGGGYKSQRGIGIEKIKEYMTMFGFGKLVKDSFFTGPEGTIPDPEWKAEHFGDDPWRLGDTYFTSIGQYGFQVTPIQVIRAISAIASGGSILNPTIAKNLEPVRAEKLDIDSDIINIIHEGMRQGVLQGTAVGLNTKDVEIAAKTGTAELGVIKENVNSWVTGFFPYEKPRYAFVFMMERGARTNLIGGVYVARTVIDWMAQNTPEYFEIK